MAGGLSLEFLEQERREIIIPAGIFWGEGERRESNTDDIPPAGATRLETGGRDGKTWQPGTWRRHNIYDKSQVESITTTTGGAFFEVVCQLGWARPGAETARERERDDDGNGGPE